MKNTIDASNNICRMVINIIPYAR